MELTETMDLVAQAFEVVGVAILILGAVFTAVRAVVERASGPSLYESMRRRFGRTLLLGLEVLVAADVVKTVAVESTLESVLILAVLVVVRTVLSLSLDAEIDGVAPWRRAELQARTHQTGPSQQG
ncbi:DUF1622 domain-containing protein [Salsipaludibacter albus]|uniref:DUF1622 domain-containing protein n=1 Tax=Salsipaludibacter albus TaxID=2849650 RepID=UPI001EE3ABD4|nr:DUF1622 domain-containing protein [Salsipaludibacter albus]MBY5162671.1 DUF1622 domain-containing protein [Salsipaludibacter albus]